LSATTTLGVPRGAARNAAIGLITLAVFTGTAARYVLSPLQELVRADLGLNDHHMALLQGLAIALPAVAFSLPIGRLVDRSNRSRLLLLLALVCCAGSLLTAFAQDFATLFVARVMVGAAVVAAQPAALSLVADLSSAEQRGRMIMLTSLGQAVGTAAAFWAAGQLLPWLPALATSVGEAATIAPWRLVQWVFAAAVLVASATLLALREPARLEAGAATGGDLRLALRALWGYRRFLLPLVLGMITVGMADAAAMIWAVPVLTRNYHQTPSDFGAWMGALSLGANLAGALFGGLAADLGQHGKGRGGVLLGAVLGAALSVPAALFPVMPNVASFGVLMALLLTAGGAVNIAATSALMVILPNELRGIGMALLVAVVGLAAFGISPLLVSLMAQLLAQADIAPTLAGVGVVTSALATAAFLFAMRDARARQPGAQDS
jgi:MFS family permease